MLPGRKILSGPIEKNFLELIRRALHAMMTPGTSASGQRPRTGEEAEDPPRPLQLHQLRKVAVPGIVPGMSAGQVKADSLASTMSSTGLSFSLTPGIARTLRDQLLEFGQDDRPSILLMAALAGIGKLVPEGLEAVELGCQVGELGSGRLSRGNVLDATQNVGERGDRRRSGRCRAWSGSGKVQIGLGRNGLWHGLGVLPC